MNIKTRLCNIKYMLSCVHYRKWQLQDNSILNLPSFIKILFNQLVSFNMKDLEISIYWYGALM